jgi:hypothetical protein
VQAALSEQLLLAVVEQLKLPLLQIARRAELGDAKTLPEIQTTADAAVKLLDNYLFGARLALDGQYELELEPVSVASVLYDSGQQLDALAKLYGVELELSLGGKFGPVMAHRSGLQSALVSLGYAMIEALPAQETSKLRLQLAAHRCRYGVVAGLYADADQLTTEALRLGRRLHGQARQPLTSVSHTSGAGVFVADAILQAMHAQLTVSKHHHLKGLGTVLQPNLQTQLV